MTLPALTEASEIDKDVALAKEVVDHLVGLFTKLTEDLCA
jgi:hypothetical protein